ncbi:breast cancer metastasis-suppressor 1-like protein [Lytechinus pictus]|uniref:breast cancer metastasis-suppressor 1-like protein n=1 Tax=Lytechinus pictus TaxID=7653 RepID=UPI00240DFD48|nr:breast cancer metastasis-suppressor 1-like protein [Lytechinus pictus]
MPSINEMGCDSEPEDMEEEMSIIDTDKSEEEESESGSSGSDDDSSEYDEFDCDRRRTECMEDMNDLESQFTSLRDQLYSERLEQIEFKLNDVKLEAAHEYLTPLHELDQMKSRKLRIASVLRELRMENIRNKLQSEEKASRENHESEKSLLRDLMKADLEDKIKRLEEDRHNIDLTTELWNESRILKQKGKKPDSLHSDRKKKPVAVSGPYIIYMLREDDILDDWTAIMKARGASARRKSDGRTSHSAKYEDGKLRYDGRMFHKKDQILIENREDSPVSARITAIDAREVWVRRHDGTKSKLLLHNLEKGKYTIQHVR